jgi:hypothetical protein
MATQVGELYYKITGDNSGLKLSLSDSEGAVGKTAEFFKKAAEAIGLAFIASKIIEWTKEVLDLGAAAEATSRRFETVFAGMGSAGADALSNLTTNYDLTNTQAENMLATNGQILQGLGVSNEKSLEYGKTLSGLAVDLASFAGKSDDVEGANRALGLALAGNTRALREYNIVLRPDALKQFAAAQGEDIDLMHDAEKANLTLQFIMQKTSGVTGDFTRNIYTFGNQLRIAKGNTEETAETMGKALLPSATSLLAIFNSMSKPIKDLADRFNEWTHSAEGVATLSNAIGTGMGILAVAVKIIKDSFEALITPFKAVEEPFRRLAGTISSSNSSWAIFGGVLNTVRFALSIIGTTIAGIVIQVIDFINVIIKAGGVVISFYDALTKKGTWADFKKSAAEAGDAFLQIGKDANDSIESIKNQTKNFVNDFSKNSKQIGDSMHTTFTDMKKDATDLAKTVMTTIPQGSKKAAEKMEENFLHAFITMMKDSKSGAQDMVKDIDSIGQGASKIFSAMGNLYAAMTTKMTNQLNKRMLAEEKAAGVADDTAVESAQKQLDAAIKSGDAQTIADAQKALKKAQIEEAYQKKIAQVKYEGDLKGWEMQVATATLQIPLATMNAIASGAQAPWFLQPAFMILMGSMAGIAASIQLAAVMAAKPQPPAFATGGVVPGRSYTGDRVTARVNSAEMILTQSQQSKLLNLATKGANQTEQNISIPVSIGGERLADLLYTKTKSGEIMIHQRSLVSR